MKTLDYNINSAKNGGKVTGFNYSRSLNELVGSWSATVAGGSFTAGNSISFGSVMTNGIITRAYKDNSGLWHVEGKDAGVKLMKTTPNIADLPTGNAQTVINNLASYCGISLSMSGVGLNGFNVRSIISGSTCAEAILELAMLSGCVAFINNGGVLCVKAPGGSVPAFSNIIDNSGSDIDLDGYATQVLVNLTRRKEENKNTDEHGSEVVYIYGKTPSTSPKTETFSGNFSNGSYSVRVLQPFDVIERLETEITKDGVKVTTEEEHDYDYESQTVWRGDQEYVLFAFYDKEYTLTKTTESTFHGTTYKEITTETLTRSTSSADPIGISEDWEDKLRMVDEETLIRSTVREGGPEPDTNMPDYSPPFDVQIQRKIKRGSNGKKLICDEVETRYEARQIGTINPVKADDVLIPHFMLDTNLAIQTHSTPVWVPIKTYRTYYEQYDEEGNCQVSSHSEYCDDGSEWLTANALSDTGDNDLNEYQEAYAKFSQHSNGLEVSIGSSQISSPWHFIELPGRTKSTKNSSDNVNLGDISNWYNNGEYIYSSHCPHYNDSTKKCNIYEIDGLNNESEEVEVNEKCTGQRWKFYSYWMNCDRAVKALEIARKQDLAAVEAPIIGMAQKGTGAKVGYQRDIYIDEILEDENAQTIANTIAANILAVKGNKGIRKTVTIPLDESYQPDGNIIEVSHDWANLQTTVTYLEAGAIPDFMISESVANIASFVSTRLNAQENIPKYGVITSYSNGQASVRIGNSIVSCTTKLKNLGVNDIVLVSFAAGNRLRGQVIARL